MLSSSSIWQTSNDDNDYTNYGDDVDNDDDASALGAASCRSRWEGQLLLLLLPSVSAAAAQQIGKDDNDYNNDDDADDAEELVKPVHLVLNTAGQGETDRYCYCYYHRYHPQQQQCSK